jgi:hypothetical protein
LRLAPQRPSVRLLAINRPRNWQFATRFDSKETRFILLCHRALPTRHTVVCCGKSDVSFFKDRCCVGFPRSPWQNTGSVPTPNKLTPWRECKKCAAHWGHKRRFAYIWTHPNLSQWTLQHGVPRVRSFGRNHFTKFSEKQHSVGLR